MSPASHALTSGYNDLSNPPPPTTTTAAQRKNDSGTYTTKLLEIRIILRTTKLYLFSECHVHVWICAGVIRSGNTENAAVMSGVGVASGGVGVASGGVGMASGGGIRSNHPATVCSYTCICTCIYMYTHPHMYTVDTCTCRSTHAHAHAHTHTHTHTHHIHTHRHPRTQMSDRSAHSSHTFS